ncbi:response regulator [Phormidium tenue FACHB-886]|nr:response regulator [Phormidium tenue FACHB-886]
MSRILIVDDIQDNILLLQTFLEAEGYSVDVESRGMAALRTIKNLRPNVVLLDVMMPDMNGYEVTQRVREDESLSDTQIVLVTAYTDISEDEAMAMGASAFIRKPIDLDQLLAIVKTLQR